MLYQKSQLKEISCSKSKSFLTLKAAKIPAVAELNVGLFSNGKETAIWNNDLTTKTATLNIYHQLEESSVVVQ